jgi:hypothetical protein
MAGGIGGLSSFGSGDACPDVRCDVIERADDDRWTTPSRALRELPPTDRPRERLAMRGPGGLTSAELFGLVWGWGYRGRSAVDVAKVALARHDGLTGLFFVK